MTTGIIYRVYNKVSGKSYIGQTRTTLYIRKQQHLNNRVRHDHYFSRALRKYEESDWEWTVLKEVKLNKLDEYEKFFIKDLNTYGKGGYNGTLGGSFAGEGNPRKDSIIYELYHPDFGEIKETISELSQRSYHFSKHFAELLSGKRTHIVGYVLSKHKDNYDQVMNLHEFYHPDFGIVKGTPQELNKKYKEILGKNLFLHQLTSRKLKIYHGWCLAENKDNYENLVDKSKIITLTHPEYGTQTLRTHEFKERYGLTDSGISFLISKKIKSSKGWVL